MTRWRWTSTGAAANVARCCSSMRTAALLSVVCLMAGCVKPSPNLSPAGQRLHQATEIVVAINAFQKASIELNAIQVCEPLPCRPLLSDRNTGIVVDAVADALTTIRAVPDGWRATTIALLDRVTMRLDAAGQERLVRYLELVRAVLGAVP